MADLFFPQSWVFRSAPALGASASMVIPPPRDFANNIQDVAWIIDHIYTRFVNLRGDGTNVNVGINVNDSGTGGNIFTWPITTNCPAGGYDVGEYDRDVNLQISPGNGFVIGYSSGGVLNCFEAIEVSGHILG